MSREPCEYCGPGVTTGLPGNLCDDEGCPQHGTEHVCFIEEAGAITPEMWNTLTCPNCDGRRKAVYFSEQSWAHEVRDCHACRGEPCDCPCGRGDEPCPDASGKPVCAEFRR